MKRITLALGLVLAGITAQACTTGQEPPRLTHAEIPRGCPLGVPGGHVLAEDTATGIALSFVSTDRAAEMRARANDVAAQHGPGQKAGLGHDGKHGEGGIHGLQLMQAPVAYSVATDIEGGARVHFMAVDAADRDLLRSKLRERAERLNSATCL